MYRHNQPDSQQPCSSRETNESDAESISNKQISANEKYVWLEKVEIEKIARIEYGWYSKNDKVEFKVIQSVEQLQAELKQYLKKKKKKLEKKEKTSLTYIINLGNYHWVTLVIAYNKQLCAYYVDYIGDELPYVIHGMLQNAVVDANIKTLDTNTANTEQCETFDCGIFALESARVINEMLHDSCVAVDKVFSNLHLIKDRLMEIRKDFVTTLEIREKIENKFKVLLKFLKKLNKQQSQIKNAEQDDIFAPHLYGLPYLPYFPPQIKNLKFNYETANIILFFLETVAMEDPVLQELDSKDPDSEFSNYQQKLLDQGVIEWEDLVRVQYIRTNKIVHRKTMSIIEPDDFEKIVNLEKNNGVKEFFLDLEKYVQLIYTRLKSGIPIQRNVRKPKQLFRSKGETENLQFGKTFESDKLRSKILNFFKNAAAKVGYKNDRIKLRKANANKIMFHFFINVAPFIDTKYGNHKSLAIEKIYRFRGELMHKFYTYGDNLELLTITLQEEMRRYKHYFFKYYYSQKIYDVLKKAKRTNNKPTTIGNNLNESLKNFQKKFGEVYLATKEDIDKENSFEFVATELVHSEIKGKNRLKNCVCDYFNLMVVVDNEEKIQERERKCKKSIISNKYKELSSCDRREIYEDLKLLKNIFILTKRGISGSEDAYNKERELLLKKFKKHYGILTKDFNAMLYSHIENSSNIERDDFGSPAQNKVEEIVIQAVLALDHVKKDFPDRSNQDIIEAFNKRKTLKSERDPYEINIKSIPENETFTIPIWSGKPGKTTKVTINTDRFIRNIFEMFNNVIMHYKLVFNNIQEAFNDEIFLDCLSNEDTSFIDHDFMMNLVEIDYIAPYIVKLVINSRVEVGVIKYTKFECVINNLLNDKCMKHLKILLKTNDETFKIIEKSDSENESDTNKQIKKPYSDIKRSTNEEINETYSEVKPGTKKERKKEFYSEIKPNIYKQICKKIIENKVDIQSMLCIFEELELTQSVLSCFINQANGSANNDNIETISKDIIKLLNSIAYELYKGGNYDGALEILETKIGERKRKAKSLIPAFTKNILEKNDLEILKIRRFIAQIKFKQGKCEEKLKQKKYEDAYNILNSIQKDIPPVKKSDILINIKPNENKELFLCLFGLLISSDIAYAKQLLKKYMDSYTEYEILYKNLISFILSDNSSTSQCILTKESYEEIKESKKYKSIFVYSSTVIGISKYLNVLKIRIDMAHQLKCCACEKERSSLPDALEYYEKALRIYNEVYDIQKELLNQDRPEISAPGIVGTMRSIAFVNNRLGGLKSREDLTEKFEQSLEHYEEALKKYKKVREIFVQEKWKTHPAVKDTDKYIAQAMRSVAYTHNRIGDLEESNDRKEDHYKKALKIYTDLYELQTNNLGEKHYFSVSALNDIALTKNKLAMVSKLQGDHEKALQYCDETCRTYENVLQIQMKTLGDGYAKVKNTENNVTQTMRNIAYMHNKIGDLHSENEPEEALKRYKRALEIYKEVHTRQKINLGEEHGYALNTLRDIGLTYNKLARLKASQGNKGEALQYYEEAYQTYNEVLEIQTTLGEKDTSVKNIEKDFIQDLRNVAYTHNKIGDSEMNPEEALRHYREAREIYRSVHTLQTGNLSEEHEYLLNTLKDIAYTNNKLALIEKSQGNREEALRYYIEVCQMLEEIRKIQIRTLDENHSDVKNTKNDIAQAMRNVAYTNIEIGDLKFKNDNKRDALEHYDEALAVYIKAYDLQISVLGKEHEYPLNTRSDIALTNNRLARANISQVKYETALQQYNSAYQIYDEVYRIQKMSFGEEHVKTKKTKENFEQTSSWRNEFILKLEKEKLDQAVNPYKGVLDRYKKILDNHKDALEGHKTAHEILLKEKWATHKDVKNAESDIAQAMRNVAYMHNRIGELEFSNGYIVEALQHHNEALEIYKNIYALQINDLSEEHEYF